MPLFAAAEAWAGSLPPKAPPTVVNAASLAGSTLSDGKGVAAVNEAAGHDNVQANSDAIANGGQATATIHQQLSATVTGVAANTARIGGEAFARFSGILNVNQAAGSANLEANSVTVARSLTPLSLSQLMAIAPPVKQINDVQLPATAAGHRAVTVADNALSGVTGIAQVSQTAGSGNSLSNSVALNISAGMRP